MATHKLTGMWRNKNTESDLIASGKLSEKRIQELKVYLNSNNDPALQVLLFKNKKREKDSDPHYNVVLAPPLPPRNQEGAPQDDEGAPF